ncbi:MAG: spore coat protein [Armatimonadetes bacterium CG07_land_8_20_14_0_80_40_9]|nr:MAG: spore coat protein [Armatimonadetes bacterium CG07_land_8_20_14_0_80_40_9]
MKGVILAGGRGTRLDPLTRVTNKHLLPIYNQPMVYYPIQILKDAGILDILIIVGGESIGDFLQLLGGGEELGVSLTYKYQIEARGIAQALGLAEDFVGEDKMVVVLGDNIIEKDVRSAVEDFKKSKAQACILLKEVEEPRRFGVAELREDKVIGVEEKPKVPKTNLAVIGIYMYTKDVFKVIKTLKPSGRGELEITDVQNYYIKRGTLIARKLEGWWTDAGTFDSLLRANSLVARRLRCGS